MFFDFFFEKAKGISENFISFECLLRQKVHSVSDRNFSGHKILAATEKEKNMAFVNYII